MAGRRWQRPPLPFVPASSARDDARNRCAVAATDTAVSDTDGNTRNTSGTGNTDNIGTANSAVTTADK
jgi:hypothetical protein